MSLIFTFKISFSIQSSLVIRWTFLAIFEVFSLLSRACSFSHNNHHSAGTVPKINQNSKNLSKHQISLHLYFASTIPWWNNFLYLGPLGMKRDERLSPVSKSNVIPGDMLAAKIRTYLSVSINLVMRTGASQAHSKNYHNYFSIRSLGNHRPTNDVW